MFYWSGFSRYYYTSRAFIIFAVQKITLLIRATMHSMLFCTVGGYYKFVFPTLLCKVFSFLGIAKLDRNSTGASYRFVRECETNR